MRTALVNFPGVRDCHARVGTIQWLRRRGYFHPRRRENRSNESKTMGDKSPKSVHKQAAQKQSKANAIQAGKQQAMAAKQAGGLKKK